MEYQVATAAVLSPYRTTAPSLQLAHLKTTTVATTQATRVSMPGMALHGFNAATISMQIRRRIIAAIPSPSPATAALSPLVQIMPTAMEKTQALLGSMPGMALPGFNAVAISMEKRLVIKAALQSPSPATATPLLLGPHQMTTATAPTQDIHGSTTGMALLGFNAAQLSMEKPLTMAAAVTFPSQATAT